MNEQLSFAGFEPAEHREILFLDSVFSDLKDTVRDHGADPDGLTRNPTKGVGGYTAVFLNSFTAFRVHMRGKQHYISIPTIFSDLVPEDAPVKQVSSETKYVRLLLDDLHPADSYREFLGRIIAETINRYPKEWDCCSLYEQCSDAKSCVQPDKNLALCCGYRKILNSGKIYYGKNRNID